MTDKDKIYLWNKICLESGYVTNNELEKWLLNSNIYFTSCGSAVPYAYYRLMIDNEYNLEVILKGSKTNDLITYILQTLCGLLQFCSINLEKKFWNTAQEILSQKIYFPSEIIPQYLMKY
jgi:hypothetical protein